MDKGTVIGFIALFFLAPFSDAPLLAKTPPPGGITLKYCEFRPFQNMKFSDYYRASASRTEAAKKTMLEIEKRTGGRIRHIYHCEETFVRGLDLLSAVRVGHYDLGGGPNVLFQAERFPVWQCSKLLFLGGPNPWATLRAWNDWPAPASPSERNWTGRD